MRKLWGRRKVDRIGIMKGFRGWGLATSRIIVLLLISFIFLYPIPYVSAESGKTNGDDIGQSQITPASPLYFLKAVREILEFKFAGTTKVKAYRQLEFATRRIREVNSLVKTPREDLIAPTLEKYAWHLQELGGIVSLQDKDMMGQVSEVVALHMNVLQKDLGQLTNQQAKRSIRLAVFKISEWNQKIISQLNLPNQASTLGKLISVKLLGCNFLSREASSSALNEVEKEVFTTRAEICFKDLKSYTKPKAD